MPGRGQGRLGAEPGAHPLMTSRDPVPPSPGLISQGACRHRNAELACKQRQRPQPRGVSVKNP